MGHVLCALFRVYPILCLVQGLTESILSISSARFVSSLMYLPATNKQLVTVHLRKYHGCTATPYRSLAVHLSRCAIKLSCCFSFANCCITVLLYCCASYQVVK